MSTNQTWPMRGYAFDAGRMAPPYAAQRPISLGLTLGGWCLFAIGLAIAGSAFDRFRPVVFGLSIHPTILAVMIVSPVLLLTRLAEFPTLPLAGLIIFTGMYSFSSLGQPGSVLMHESFKTGAIVLTVIATALLVRSREDFNWGVLGLALAAILISIRAMQGNVLDGETGAIESGNKNTISLYVLPSLLLSLYLVFQKQSTSLWFKAILAGSAFMIAAGTFTTGNRSGWLGVALCVCMLLLSARRIMALVLVILLSAGTYYFITNFGTTAGFEFGLEKTFSGYESDTVRLQLIEACFDIGVAHPILGISPYRLPYEVGRILGTEPGAAHNVLAHLIAASGFICTGALLFVGWTLWRWKPATSLSPEQSKSFRTARGLLRMMLFLWLVRGQFTHEIIYSPSFGIGLGLAIGLCLTELRMSHAPAGARLAAAG